MVRPLLYCDNQLWPLLYCAVYEDKYMKKAAGIVLLLQTSILTLACADIIFKTNFSKDWSGKTTQSE